MTDYILKIYKDNLKLILLVINAIGYVFLKTYYEIFNISIEYFISPTDLFFFSIKLLFYFVLIVLITELISLGIVYSLSRNIDLKNKPDKVGFIQIIVLFIALFYSIYSESQILYTGTVIPSLIALKYLTLYRNPKMGKKEFQKKILLLIIIILFLFTVIFGMYESKKIITGKTNVFNKEIQFIDNKEQISTGEDSDFIFIGETSNTLFLYNKNSNKSLVFSKKNLKELTINVNRNKFDFLNKYMIPRKEKNIYN